MSGLYYTIPNRIYLPTITFLAIKSPSPTFYLDEVLFGNVFTLWLELNYCWRDVKQYTTYQSIIGVNDVSLLVVAHINIYYSIGFVRSMFTW